MVGVRLPYGRRILPDGSPFKAWRTVSEELVQPHHVQTLPDENTGIGEDIAVDWAQEGDGNAHEGLWQRTNFVANITISMSNVWSVETFEIVCISLCFSSKAIFVVEGERRERHLWPYLITVVFDQRIS